MNSTLRPTTYTVTFTSGGKVLATYTGIAADKALRLTTTTIYPDGCTVRIQEER